MHDPLDDTLAKCEVIPGEEYVAENDGDSGEDSYAKETKDVFPNRRSFLHGKRMTNLSKGSPDRCFLKCGEPFVRVSLLFSGK